MNKFLSITLILCLGLAACKEDPPGGELVPPTTYTFERNSTSSVSFGGQSTRISMGEELIAAMNDFGSTETKLLEMYRNQTESGEDANPFTDPALNASTKSIKSKVAASADYFSSNTAESAEIKADFESWIKAQVAEVFPRENDLASPGNAGQIADGTSVRYVSAKGLEYNQALNKAMIGALMMDQMANNYLSDKVLDAGDNLTNNTAKTLEEGENYTSMEHKWDEAYGYLFGASPDAVEPLATLGADDNFFNKYLGRVEDDPDFAGIASDIFDAFKLGRAAIVANEYGIRFEQALLLKADLSRIIAIRAVYYLQQGKNNLPTDGNLNNYGPAFHDLSEGYGFVYSLRFTHNALSGDTYFSRTEVDGYLDDLMAGDGFWDLSPETLDAISEAIASRFNFTVAEAAE